MIGKRMIPNIVIICFIQIFLFLSPHILISEDCRQPRDCIDKAFKRIKEIRSFPEMKFLYTLDGQSILLSEFYARGLSHYPMCCPFKKFYYWQSEIREVISNTKNGNIKHKIRCYHNCLSTFCPESCDPRKTHGDIAEFYDANGVFMGIAVYVGDGKYCSIPYHGYQK